MKTALLVTAALSALPAPQVMAKAGPEMIETRVIDLTQHTTLHNVPGGARIARMWVPLPSDTQWQRVTDLAVTGLPQGANVEWKLVRQVDGRGKFLYVEVDRPTPGNHTVTVRMTVERTGIAFDLQAPAPSHTPYDARLLGRHMDKKAPLMEVTPEIQQWANSVCGNERDPARQMLLLLQAVAERVNHYSKDASLPHCGIGSAGNCLDQGGGCCTDLHALFIAMARARDLPARIQFGYRTLDHREGEVYDPTYRCWVEVFIPGHGWVPTDLVAGDATNSSNPYQWGSLSSTRVWLWEGRSFELTPAASAGPIHTMIAGWAKVDGRTIDFLPAEDGTPSNLQRRISFQVRSNTRTDETPRLPQ